MYFSSTVIVFSAVSAVAATTSGQRISIMAIRSIFERQVNTCIPVRAPATCERSCGRGNIECISFPNCYNPGAGESCCSNGKYCRSGYYCTDAGCCPNGVSLARCGATESLSIILPPAPTTQAPTTRAPIPTVDPTTTTEATRTPESTTSTTSTTSRTSRTPILDSTTSEDSTTSTTSSSRSSSSPRPSALGSATLSASPAASSISTQGSTNDAPKLGSVGFSLVLGGVGVIMMVL
ncbi:hypothetical protein VTL71DRAFT_4702 [Oculimacula yallundae]|uniref:Uncharacterized protein n=1 Tax=Oculimacula yallundae TaxID=86028 RepID=A0ABR4C544_9HELO